MLPKSTAFPQCVHSISTATTLSEANAVGCMCSQLSDSCAATRSRCMPRRHHLVCWTDRDIQCIAHLPGCGGAGKGLYHTTMLAHLLAQPLLLGGRQLRTTCIAACVPITCIRASRSLLLLLSLLCLLSLHSGRHRHRPASPLHLLELLLRRRHVLLLLLLQRLLLVVLGWRRRPSLLRVRGSGAVHLLLRRLRCGHRHVACACCCCRCGCCRGSTTANLQRRARGASIGCRRRATRCVGRTIGAYWAVLCGRRGSRTGPRLLHDGRPLRLHARGRAMHIGVGWPRVLLRPSRPGWGSRRGGVVAGRGRSVGLCYLGRGPGWWVDGDLLLLQGCVLFREIKVRDGGGLEVDGLLEGTLGGQGNVARAHYSRIGNPHRHLIDPLLLRHYLRHCFCTEDR
mmetsp:Transcript_25962/g.70367  ORF Transcript_25962/g.70367 Transcript_25962/m.70367 type:complete len:398 (+) Transcript_25962:624-1817(+)